MLAVAAKAVKVSARAITKPKSLEWVKDVVRNNKKHLREFLRRKMLIIDCETWRLSVVLVSMTIFGQNDFLECFHSHRPNISFD